MMRSTTSAALAVITAATLALTACGDDAPAEPTYSSSYDPMTDPDRAEAIKDSETTIRKGWAVPDLKPLPDTLYTEMLVTERQDQIAAAKKAGHKVTGADKVLSITAKSTSWERPQEVVGPQRVSSVVCAERNLRWLDKDGKDIRGDQDGKPVKVGSRAEYVVRTVRGEGDQEPWVIDSITEQGPCAAGG